MSLTAKARTRLDVVKSAILHGTAPSAWGPHPGRREDIRADFWTLYDQVVAYTMTSPERLFALREAIHYVAAARVPGDVVECGVWRGGSSMMAALAMREVDDHRRLWLYDTFEGMTEPGEHDRDYKGTESRAEYQRRLVTEGGWSRATIEDVRANLADTGYDTQLISYVRGRVEDTIPRTVPNEIALLRLDTDWYESTRHELEHLWPKLSRGGVLIIDDYGHFEGCRKAVNEYFDAERTPVLLSRIDYTGRMTVKP